jgi:hypothetical protein
MADNDDITVLESTSNHISVVNEKRPTTIKKSTIPRRQVRQLPRRQQSNPRRIKIADNHLTRTRV